MRHLWNRIRDGAPAASAAALGLFCLDAPAAADVAVLKTGGTVEGEIVRGEGWIEIRTPVAVVRVAAGDVERVEVRETPLQAYRRRAAALEAGDADGRRALAAWCRERGLRGEERTELEAVIRLAPDDAESRRRLGFVLHDGRWMTEAEARIVKGLVRDGTDWVTREESERRRAQREAAKRHEAIAKALQAAFEAMKSPDAATRARGRAAAKAAVDTYALPPEVSDWADRVKATSDAYWEGTVVSGGSPKVLMELHLANYDFQGFRRLLINPPINAVLQLPYGTYQSYHGTVLVPAGSSAR